MNLIPVKWYVFLINQKYTGSNESSHNFDKEEYTFAKSQAMVKETKEWNTPECKSYKFNV